MVSLGAPKSKVVVGSLQLSATPGHLQCSKVVLKIKYCVPSKPGDHLAIWMGQVSRFWPRRKQVLPDFDREISGSEGLSDVKGW